VAKKIKKRTKNPHVKKRKNRSKFRPTFRGRAVYSFACAIENIETIRDTDDQEEEFKGMIYISCFRNLSHSIEMLCKAVLAQRSLFLLNKNLNSFDELFPKSSEQEENCGAWVALARASKLFKSDFTNEESGRLERILFARNRCEHGEFYIPNFQNEMHTIASAAEIVVRVYDKQFRNGNLIQEVDKFCSEDAIGAYKSTIQENSKDFKALEKKVAAMRKKGTKLVVCWTCHYGFAQLNSTEDEYTCLWCNDTRKKKVCQSKGCGDEFWDTASGTRTNCFKFHIGDQLSLGSMTLGQAMLGSTGTPSMSSMADMLNFGSGSIASGASSLASATPIGSWIDMSGAANPKLDEDQTTDEKSGARQKTEEK